MASGSRAPTSPSTATAVARGPSPSGRRRWGSSGPPSASSSPKPSPLPTPSPSVPVSWERRRAALADLIAAFGHGEDLPAGGLVHCPAHRDSRQSLRLTVSDKGKVLVRCRAGCDTADVVEALGLTMRDLATMKPGDVAFTPATSTDAPASVEDVARLAVALDAWAAALAKAVPNASH